jgi:predicted nucleic-acid-binding Zn-ribbon protein
MVEQFILTKDNYFSREANEIYMSVSQFKSFVPELGGCEAAAMAKIKGEWDPEEKDALLFGKAVHAWNDGALAEFKRNHPDLYKKDGTVYAKFAGIEDCIEALKNDPVCMVALEGEKERIFTAHMFGVPWKIMIDSYNPNHGMFSDLKVMKSLYDRYWSKAAGCYVNFVEYYGYDIQMAVYTEVERLATGRAERLDPHIVPVTKETPPDKIVLKGFLPVVDKHLAYVGGKMPRIIDVKYNGAEPIMCGRCEYCRGKKKASIMDYHELLV